MSRILKAAGIFVLGLMLGATAMSYLASRASSIYARGLQLSFAFEQQRQGALAAKNGDWLTAAMAYHNMAAAESTWIRPFGVENQQWDVSLPLAAPVLERVSRAADPDGKGKRIAVSIAHARYALALEKIGFKDHATREWSKAMQSGGFTSVEGARSLALNLLDQDIRFFGDR